MKKYRIIAVLAIMIALLIPGAVNAAGTFYCSTSVAVGGSGTLIDPWACSDATQLQSVVDDQICAIYSGGDLYQIFPASYRYHVVTWYSVDDCRITASYDYAGYPPSTGLEIGTPFIVGGVALLGAGLVTAGLLIRRRRATTAA